jgi:hypothetical protein
MNILAKAASAGFLLGVLFGIEDEKTNSQKRPVISELRGLTTQKAAVSTLILTGLLILGRRSPNFSSDEPY